MWIFVGALLVTAFIAGRPLFKHIAAVGGQRNAAFQTGLRVDRIRIAAYVICALFASVASLCLTGETASGDPLMGRLLALSSVSAVVLGGTALAGGSGSAFGSVLGALVIGMIATSSYLTEYVPKVARSSEGASHL